MTTDVEQANFSTLANTTRYFDTQGDELLTSGGSPQPDANSTSRVYDVKVTITTPATVMGQKSYNTASVQILIANNPGHDPHIFDSGKPYSTYSTLVARKF